MSDSIERAIPAACPCCTTLLAAHYTDHCPRWCGWVKCNYCGAVIDTRTGRHMGGKVPG